MKYSIKFVRPNARQRHHGWRLAYRNNGKRIRQMFDTQELAKAHIDQVKDDLNRAGAIWVSLSAQERNDIMAVISEVKAAGAALRTVWEYYKNRSTGQERANLSGLKVLQELMADKTEAKLSGDYRDNLEHYVSEFIKGREEKPQREYIADEVKVFLRQYAEESRSTIRSRLSTWFLYGFERSFCAGNPCGLIQLAKIIRPPPRIFSFRELKALLKWLCKHPRAFAWFILSTRCGFRPGEARKTEPGMMKIREGWIRVEAQTTKVRHRRVVEPGPEAMKALKAAMDHGGELPLTKQQLRDELREMRKVLKLERWPADITRHTAASILIAITKDVDDVALMLGTSEQKLHTNYKALLTRKEADKLLTLLNDTPQLIRSLCKG